MFILERLRLSNNRPAGFDYLRIALAVGVFSIHIIPLWSGAAETDRLLLALLRPLAACILPMFFALSGFLVAGSLARTSGLVAVVKLRVIRIASALFVDVSF